MHVLLCEIVRLVGALFDTGNTVVSFGGSSISLLSGERNTFPGSSRGGGSTLDVICSA